MPPWWPLLRPLFWYPIILQKSLQLNVEDHVPPDFIFWHVILQWLEYNDRVPIQQFQWWPSGVPCLTGWISWFCHRTQWQPPPGYQGASLCVFVDVSWALARPGLILGRNNTMLQPASVCFHSSISPLRYVYRMHAEFKMDRGTSHQLTPRGR